MKFRHPEGGLLKLGDKNLKTYVEPGGKPVLLGSHLADPEAGSLVICFGDYDAMSSYQDGVPNSVSLPFGDRGFDFVREQWDFIDSFQEIILFPDNDQFKNRETAAKAFEKLESLAKRLGMHRVRLVSRSAFQGIKDANELLVKKGKGSIKKAVDEADHFPVENLVRVANYKAPDFEPGQSTGFDHLDQHIGGFNPGDLILIGGDNGSEKTTTALRFIAESVEQRSPVFLWTGEQTVGQIRYWYERIVAGPSNIKTVNARAGYKVYFPHDQYLPHIRAWYQDYFFQFDNWFIDAPLF
ncbi:MAG: DnaB-like helicase C-terminal domain-containing protein, partial [Candidatus Binatia bacterium]